MKRAVFAMAVLLLGSTTIVARGQSDDAFVAGERVFRDQGCYGCHMVGRFGTPIGPDLSRIGAKYSHAEIERWLRDPEFQRPGAHMPRLELDADEVRVLAVFLAAQR